jgi:hypothetical protein
MGNFERDAVPPALADAAFALDMADPGVVETARSTASSGGPMSDTDRPEAADEPSATPTDTATCASVTRAPGPALTPRRRIGASTAKPP